MVNPLEFSYNTGKFQANELEEMFPPIKDFSKKELGEAQKACIYDLLQIDSEVEKNFALNYLAVNDSKVICYFKFPLKCKVELTGKWILRAARYGGSTLVSFLAKTV